MTSRNHERFAIACDIHHDSNSLTFLNLCSSKTLNVLRSTSRTEVCGAHADVFYKTREVEALGNFCRALPAADLDNRKSARVWILGFGAMEHALECRSRKLDMWCWERKTFQASGFLHSWRSRTEVARGWLYHIGGLSFKEVCTGVESLRFAKARFPPPRGTVISSSTSTSTDSISRSSSSIALHCTRCSKFVEASRCDRTMSRRFMIAGALHFTCPIPHQDLHPSISELHRRRRHRDVTRGYILIHSTQIKILSSTIGYPLH